MSTGFTSIFSFPQGSCSFFPTVLVPELHTPVCEKLCSRKLQLLSWLLTLEPPESSFPPWCQSCACVLALWIAAVCNSTTYTNLSQRAGLGLSATCGLYFLCFFWGSVVLLIQQCNACQKSGVLSESLCLRPRPWEEWDFQKSEQHGLKVIWMHGCGGCINWAWEWEYPGEKQSCFITALTRSYTFWNTTYLILLELSLFFPFFLC